MQPSVGTPEERSRVLRHHLRRFPETCSSCPLFASAFVPPTEIFPAGERGNGGQRKGQGDATGRGSIDLLFVGEAPGVQEAVRGEPFVGPAGRILRAALDGIPSSYVLTNAVLCHPPDNRKPSREEMLKCRAYLNAQIAAANPKMIVALGDTALKALTGREHILMVNGQILPGAPPVLACVHPSYTLHTGNVSDFEQGILPAVQLHLQGSFGPPKYEVVASLPDVGACAFDIETPRDRRPHQGEIRCMAQSNGTTSHFTGEPLPWDLMANKERLERGPLIAHQAQFEYAWLLAKGIDPNITDDTRLMAYLIDESSPTGLESLSVKYGLDSPYKVGDTDALRGDELAGYNCRDARNTYLLYKALLPQLSPGELKVYREVFMPAAKNLARTELKGLCVDSDELRSVEAKLDEALADLHVEDERPVRELMELCGKAFNVKSYPQMKILVYDLLGYEPHPLGLTESKSPSTKKEVLERLLGFRDDATLRKVIRYSELTGLKVNFLSVVKKHLQRVENKHFVFTSLWLGETSTGRVKSNNPNLQNVPVEFVRRMFVSRYEGGTLLDADHDQVELRVLAGLSMDERLISSLIGGDPHTDTARAIFRKENITKKERDLAKRINFAIPTGASPGRIAFEAGLPLEEARALLRNYWSEHKRLREYFDSLPESGTVYSPTGMKRTVTGERAKNQARSFAIQNSALVLHLMTVNELVPFLEENACSFALPTHDGYLSDLRRGSRDLMLGVKEILERPRFGWMPVPFTASLKAGRNWWDMTPVEEVKA